MGTIGPGVVKPEGIGDIHRKSVRSWIGPGSFPSDGDGSLLQSGRGSIALQGGDTLKYRPHLLEAIVLRGKGGRALIAIRHGYVERVSIPLAWTRREPPFPREP